MAHSDYANSTGFLHYCCVIIIQFTRFLIDPLNPLLNAKKEPICLYKRAKIYRQRLVGFNSHKDIDYQPQ